MSLITTHVLDTAAGRPLAALRVTLSGPRGEIATGETDADGRIRELGPDALEPGEYRLEFAAGTPFYPRVTIHFNVRPGQAHYHVPLLLSPYGYATYRGS